MATRFVIVCAARTGSTMLRLMLDSHPQICCHGEALGAMYHLRNFNGVNGDRKSNLLDFMIDLRVRDSARFLEEFVFLPGNFSAVGLKIKYSELQVARLEAVFGWLCGAADVKLLNLTRKSGLRRYVSHLQATTTGVNRAKSERDRPVPVKMKLSFDECVESIVETQAAAAWFRERFATHEVFDLVYEDVIAGLPAQIDGVQRFLGVVPQALTTSTVKLGVSNLDDVIDNFSELQQRAHGTEFESDFI